MLALFDPFALFAVKRDLRSMSEGFRSRSMDDQAFETLIVAGVLLAICIGLLLIGRYSRRFENMKSYNSPPELFRELCRAHRLSWSSRRLLKRLAAEWELTSPASLFVEPERFNTTRLRGEWQEKAEHVERIRRQLFETS